MKWQRLKAASRKLEIPTAVESDPSIDEKVRKNFHPQSALPEKSKSVIFGAAAAVLPDLKTHVAQSRP